MPSFVHVLEGRHFCAADGVESWEEGWFWAFGRFSPVRQERCGLAEFLSAGGARAGRRHTAWVKACGGGGGV